MRTVWTFLLLASTAAAADNPKPAPGNYLLSYYPRPLAEQRMALLKIEADGGKPSISTLDGGRDKAEASKLEVSDKGVVTCVVGVAGGAIKLAFEGRVDPNDPKRVLGSLGDDARTFAAELVATDDEKFDPKPKTPDLPAELKDAEKLLQNAGLTQFKARRTKDPEEKKKLLAEAEEAEKKANAEAPALYKKVAADHAGTPVAAIAAGELLERLGKWTATPDEAKQWAAAVVGHAAKYGPKIERAANARVAAQLVKNDTLAAAAVPFAKAVAESDAPNREKQKAYRVLATAYRAAGNADLAKTAGDEAARLDGVLDQEYLATVPPFKPTKFGARKGADANRVAVLELFTGSECPPCVAADVAFDALAKAYKPADAVLLQYHLHIPGPDPLTNPTSVARFAYYGEKFPKDMGGTPSTLVNGKPAAGGGGSMAMSEGKFTEFRSLLDPSIEDKAAVTLDGSAKQAGDAVAVDVAVTKAKDLPDDARLRLLLVEDTVRYVGGNGVRFHHHVVRAAVGPAEGVKVSALPEGKHAASVDLAEVRKSLAGYLTEAAKDRPFSNPDRPLELKGLKVIALVQDDASGEILQARELPVTGS